MEAHKTFAHAHSVRIYEAEPEEEIHCAGCELPASGPVYGCKPCNHFLHQKCGDTKRFIQHSAHPDHHLTLMAMPTYFAGSFLCNACGDIGNAFSFSCAACEFDLHVTCADLPLSIDHQPHPHALTLTYGLELDEASAFICDVCDKQLDPKHWIYYCATCDFGAHLHCATPAARPPPQEQNSRQDVASILEAHCDMLNDQRRLHVSQKLSQLLASYTPSR